MYRDPTPIRPTNPEYDKNKVDPRVSNYTKQVREKTYGRDTREAMARAEEISSIVASEAKEIAESTGQRQDAVEQQFNTLLGEWSDDKPIDNAETIAARTNTKESKTYENLGKRLDEEYGKITAQLAETVNDLNERGVNVERFGAIGDFNPETGMGTDNTVAFNEASEFARDNGLYILVPNKRYKIDGELVIYTSLLGEGSIYFPNENTTARLKILPTEDFTVLDPDLLTGLDKGSSKIGGLPGDLKNHVICIDSSEEFMNRYNPPYNKPYLKQDTSAIISSDGTISPKLLHTYDASKINTIKLIKVENRLTIEVNIYGYGGVDKTGDLVYCSRSNVYLSKNIISNKNNGSQRVIRFENACFVEFDNVTISGAHYDGFGYGLNIENSSHVVLNHTHISDCRRPLSGFNAKKVIVNGGSYTGTSGSIDGHWGGDYLIENAELNGPITYAGQDIVLRGNIIRGTSALNVRTDTPEISGNIEIDDNEIMAGNGSYNLISIYRLGMTYPSDFSFGRILKSPDTLIIKRNRIIAPTDKPLYIFFHNSSNYDHELPSFIETEDNICVNGNRITNQIHLNSHVTNDFNLLFKNEDFRSRKHPDNVGDGDVALRIVGIDNNSLVKINFENCENVATRIPENIIADVKFINSTILILHQSNTNNFKDISYDFYSCRLSSTFISESTSPLHFYNSVFEGDLTVGSMAEARIKLLSGCRKTPGTNNFTSKDLMNFSDY